MRTVQISDDVYTALQGLAIPFEDDINDVLRRLLRDHRSTNGNGARLAQARVADAAPKDAATTDSITADSTTVVVHRRARSNGEHLPQTAFRSAVLGVLRASPKPVDISELYNNVEQQLGDRMTDGDLATSHGEIRWHTQTRNALAQLMHEGAIVQLPQEHYQFRNGQRRP